MKYHLAIGLLAISQQLWQLGNYSRRDMVMRDCVCMYVGYVDYDLIVTQAFYIRGLSAVLYKRGKTLNSNTH
jgi:hypothetical protein